MRISNELKQVGPLDGVPAREPKDRHFPGGNQVNELAFRGAKLFRMAIRLRGGAAMHAGKIARLRDFPDRNERTLIEIDGLNLRVHASIRSASSRKLR